MQHEQPPMIEQPIGHLPANSPAPQLPPRMSEQALEDAALAACPGHEDDVDLVRKWLRSRDALAGLKTAIEQFKVGRDDDPALIAKCDRIVEDRVDLEALLFEQALADWWPGWAEPH